MLVDLLSLCSADWIIYIDLSLASGVKVDGVGGRETPHLLNYDGGLQDKGRMVERRGPSEVCGQGWLYQTW